MRPSAWAIVGGLLFSSAVAGQDAPAPDLPGTWLGSLEVPGASLRIVFHIEADDEGRYAATMDSPDQGATGIATSGAILEGDSVRIEVPAVGGVYAGIVEEDTIRGRWTQGGRPFPVVLTRVDEVERPSRPQTPSPPYPYASRDVTFESADAGVTLAGTVTLPRGPGPHPAVVLISGSGPQDRNETIMGHEPFHVLADHLTREGVAVLRYDDRGVGGSTGDHSAATSEDLADDAVGAIRRLAELPEVDTSALGLVGHSEGGLIAPIVTNRTGKAAFLVLLAAPGRAGEAILRAQGELLVRASGGDDATVRLQREVQAALFRVARSGMDSARAVKVVRKTLDSLRAGLPEEERAAVDRAMPDSDAYVGAQVRQATSPWFRFFLDYDPRPALRRVDVPVLALGGTKDLQVPAEENLAAIEDALRAGENERVTTRALQGLNHLFQHAGTGSPAEYARIEETFAPEALQAISGWILEQF